MYGIVKGKVEQLRLAVLILLGIATVRLMAMANTTLDVVDPVGASASSGKVAKEFKLMFTGSLIASIGECRCRRHAQTPNAPGGRCPSAANSCAPRRRGEAADDCTTPHPPPPQT